MNSGHTSIEIEDRLTFLPNVSHPNSACHNIEDDCFLKVVIIYTVLLEELPKSYPCISSVVQWSK